MFHQIRLLKGVLYPKILSYQLKKTEAVSGVWSRVLLLMIASSAVFALGAFLGIGTESLSKEITSITRQEFEMKKLLFLSGQAIWGLFFALIFIFLPALFFWTLTDIEFKKLAAVQSYAFVILLAGKAVILISSLLLNVDPFHSPFSFGVIIQYFTESELLIKAFGLVTLFHFWVMYIQYYYLQECSEKDKKTILLIILAWNLFLWLISTLLSYMKLENLL